MGLASRRRKRRSENPKHAKSRQSNFARPEPHFRQRRLGARLLPEIQQPPSRIPASLVERNQLGRNQQTLPILNQEVALQVVILSEAGTSQSEVSRVVERPLQVPQQSISKELRNPSPILPHNQIRTQMPAPPQQSQ